MYKFSSRYFTTKPLQEFQVVVILIWEILGELNANACSTWLTCFRVQLLLELIPPQLSKPQNSPQHTYQYAATVIISELYDILSSYIHTYLPDLSFLRWQWSEFTAKSQTWKRKILVQSFWNRRRTTCMFGRLVFRGQQEVCMKEAYSISKLPCLRIIRE